MGMNTEKATPADIDRPSIPDILAEMTTLVAKIQDTTATMKREDVDRFIRLSFSLATVLHSLTAEAHDYCTRFKAQVLMLTTSNGTMADIFLDRPERSAPVAYPEKGNAC